MSDFERAIDRYGSKRVGKLIEKYGVAYAQELVTMCSDDALDAAFAQLETNFVTRTWRKIVGWGR